MVGNLLVNVAFVIEVSVDGIRVSGKGAHFKGGFGGVVFDEFGFEALGSTLCDDIEAGG